MKFADFFPGQVIDAGPYLLTQEELVAFARAWDPQWFHTDAMAAENGHHQGLISSGWQTCCIAMRLVALAALEGSESFASPGLNYVKWRHPVRPDDSLQLRATVLEVRRSSSKPDLGILTWRWQLFNQANVEVLDLEATSLFKLSST